MKLGKAILFNLNDERLMEGTGWITLHESAPGEVRLGAVYPDFYPSDESDNCLLNHGEHYILSCWGESNLSESPERFQCPVTVRLDAASGSFTFVYNSTYRSLARL